MGTNSCQLLPAEPLGVITPTGEFVANDSIFGVQLLVFVSAITNKQKNKEKPGK